MDEIHFSKDGTEWLSPEEAFKKGWFTFDNGFIASGWDLVCVRPPRTLWEHICAWWNER
jgi:hypothetical protein